LFRSSNVLSSNSLTPSLINLDCGPNIEDHLSSREEFDDVEDEYSDEDHVVVF
jgi:hypothetical protein